MGRARNQATATGAPARTVTTVPTIGERIAQERIGTGGLPVQPFGFLVTHENVPEHVEAVHGYFGPNEAGEEDTQQMWAHAPVENLPADALLHTGQLFVSPTALQELTADMTTDPDGVVVWPDDPWLIRYENETWISDGHHRVVRARQANKPCRVRVVDATTVFVDYELEDFWSGDDDSSSDTL